MTISPSDLDADDDFEQEGPRTTSGAASSSGELEANPQLADVFKAATLHAVDALFQARGEIIRRVSMVMTATSKPSDDVSQHELAAKLSTDFEQFPIPTLENIQHHTATLFIAQQRKWGL